MASGSPGLARLEPEKVSPAQLAAWTSPPQTLASGETGKGVHVLLLKAVLHALETERPFL